MSKTSIYQFMMPPTLRHSSHTLKEKKKIKSGALRLHKHTAHTLELYPADESGFGFLAVGKREERQSAGSSRPARDMAS